MFVSKDKPVSMSLMSAALDHRYGRLDFVTKREDRDRIWRAVIEEAVKFDRLMIEDENFRIPKAVFEVLAQQVLRPQYEYQVTDEDCEIHPLVYWTYNTTVQQLIPLVRMMFATPASSAGAERAFSNLQFVVHSRYINLCKIQGKF